MNMEQFINALIDRWEAEQDGDDDYYTDDEEDDDE